MQLQPAVRQTIFTTFLLLFLGGAVPKKIPSNPPNKRTRILLLWCFFESPWNVGRSEMAIQWISPNFSKFIILKIILKSLSLTFSMFPNQPSTMKVPTLNPQAHPSPDSKTIPPQPPTASLRCAPSTAEKCHLSHCTRRFGTLTQDGTPWKAGMLGRKKHGEFNEKQTQQ